MLDEVAYQRWLDTGRLTHHRLTWLEELNSCLPILTCFRGPSR